MTLAEYEQAACRTMNTDGPRRDHLVCRSLGLAGEAGEVADYIKKVVYHHHDMDTKKLVKELGDVLWYIAALSNAVGIPLEEVAKVNIAKLTTRYPNGFTTADSIKRVDE